MKKEVKVKIFRFDPGKDEKGRYETYSVPYQEHMRLTEVIHYIQKHFDGTLAFRENCRSGRCGSDAVEVNGKAVLACKTTIENEGEITISPMKVFPIIKDLVVDISYAWQNAQEIQPFKPTSKPPWKIMQEEIEEVREFRKCIECFICHDVCHVFGHNRNYIGPRFIINAAALDKHPKDSVKGRHKILSKKGLWLCNTSRCCQQNCPENIRITDDAIIHEKEKNVDKSASFSALIKRIKKKHRIK